MFNDTNLQSLEEAIAQGYKFARKEFLWLKGEDTSAEELILVIEEGMRSYSSAMWGSASSSSGGTQIRRSRIAELRRDGMGTRSEGWRWARALGAIVLLGQQHGANYLNEHLRGGTTDTLYHFLLDIDYDVRSRQERERNAGQE